MLRTTQEGEVISSKQERLAERESRLESAVTQAFVAAGEELRGIRDEKLYGEGGAGFATFEDYCLVRWQMHRDYAYKLIACAGVLDELSVYNCIQMPRNAGVARELIPLLPEPPIMGKAWKEAVETAPKDDKRPIITAKHVKEVVRKYLHDADEPGKFPATGYRVVYADPPWKYSDELIKGYGAAHHHYPQLRIDELCEMTDANGKSVREIVADNAVLFMWVTSPMLFDCAEVVHAWGFDYRTSFVWDKVKHNYGHYNSVRHELLLICTRGSCTPDSKTLHDSVVSIERSKKHSEKPERFREIIDELYPPPADRVDRIELFARTQVSAWDSYGNQAH